MKIIILLIILTFFTKINSQVSINTSGAVPEASSMLDVSSSSKGVLIPRMTTADRDLIVSPATSLMIFNTTTNAYNYWNGSAWIAMAAGNIKELSDADNDSKVEIEKNPDEDKIRFTANGYEIGLLDNKSFQLKSPGQSVFIGENAGLNDDGTDNFNSFVGFEAGKTNISGSSNTFFGHGAGDVNTASDNTFIGRNAGGANTNGSENTFIGQGAGASNTSIGSNTFVGSGSGSSNFNGGNNTFLGRHAGFGNTSGTGNTFVGSGAGDANNAGSNTFIGMDAGGSNTGGGENTFVGRLAGGLNTTASGNTFIGQAAGSSNITGNGNTFVGQSAGLLNTASNNTFIGKSAGTSNTSGTANTFVGQGAGDVNTASNNTFVGKDAGGANTSGQSNTFVGTQSGLVNIDGTFNAFMGVNAGNANTSGSSNTFLGSSAGAANNSGGVNTFIGRNAGDTNASGTSNTCIGEDSDVLTNALTNATAIGANAVVNTSNSLVLGSGADVGIGTSSPDAKLEVVDAVAGTVSPVAIIFNTTNVNTSLNNGLFVRAGHNTYNAAFESAMIRFLRPDGSGIGSITQSSASAVAYNTSSDMRLKENIQDTKFGLIDIMQIQVSDYNYKNDSNHIQTGYIAQQLHAIFPNAVHVGSEDVENDPWMVDYGRITPLLVKGMQDQQKMIEDRSAIIEQQSLRLEALEKQIEKLSELVKVLNSN